ncbi:glycosyltransferase family 2 protein [Aeromicrobium sp. CTD01-1L150]|uniref:glycosyltransferase family 2 protein n=1 Tax=Aeromicrobium sp. CTD01-1L150 TaxID=3341830 RepID=UPI0035C128F2
MEPPTTTCDIVIPCRDEAAALPLVLADVPDGFAVVVVDNGSSDGTADVAQHLGARVVHEARPGYGAAVHAGVEAATAEFVAVVDGDDSMTLADLPAMLEDVRAGAATMAVGRRRPVARGVWPWHARAGTLLLATWLRRSSGFGIHDLAPMRVCRRADLLDLGIEDRRFGYPLELMVRASQAGWTVLERDVDYRPRAAGTRSKVSGSLRGTTRTIRDFGRVLRTVRTGASHTGSEASR